MSTSDSVAPPGFSVVVLFFSVAFIYFWLVPLFSLTRAEAPVP